MLQLLGGIFGSGGDPAVVQLLELRHMDRRLVCAVHADSQLRIWDPESRRLVHTAELLPSDAAAGLVPALVRLTGALCIAGGRL